MNWNSKEDRRKYKREYMRNYTKTEIGSKKRDSYRRSLKGRYKMMVDKAKKFSQECSLSFEQYCEVVKSNECFFCFESLPEKGFGVDRVNSSVGYVLGNVRPCCEKCNRAKNDMTESEFKEWILRVYNRYASF